MSNFFEKIKSMCVNASKKREIEIVDNQIAKLQEKKNNLLGKATSQVIVNVSAEVTKKSKMQVTSQELLINVAANVYVKDVCRNIERKLNRNLQDNNASDFQILYNHLHKFYSIKHVNTLPQVTLKNGKVTMHIDDYVKMRTNSVIKDASCHVTFGKDA